MPMLLYIERFATWIGTILGFQCDSFLRFAEGKREGFRAQFLSSVVLRHINDDRVCGLRIHFSAVRVRPVQHVPERV